MIEKMDDRFEVEAVMTKAARWMAVAAMVVTMAGTMLRAQSAVPEADQKGIQKTLDSFGSTLTKMDFDSFGKLFTEDADFVNIVGMHWHGKAQIVKAHRVVFTTRYKGVPQHIVESSYGSLAPGLVLVTSTIKMDDYTAQDGQRMTDNLFRMTWVMEKQGSGWLIRSAANVPINIEAAAHDPGK
jgi:uncharacterized protein (TIGR02246 family)